jgi:hypothetical protein
MSDDDRIAALQAIVRQLAENNVALRRDVDSLGKRFDSLACHASPQSHCCKSAQPNACQGNGCGRDVEIDESPVRPLPPTPPP